MYRTTISAAACAVVFLVSAVPAVSETRAHNPFDRPLKIPYLTASDVREISAKIGVPLEIGYAFVGGNSRKPIQIPSQGVASDDRTAKHQITSQSVASNDSTFNEVPRSSSSHPSPSFTDLSQLPPNYVPPPYIPDPGAYSARLEARSLKIFPWASQEEDRQRWMAEQEQREIANQINASKPLLFPVSSH